MMPTEPEELPRKFLKTDLQQMKSRLHMKYFCFILYSYFCFVYVYCLI